MPAEDKRRETSPAGEPAQTDLDPTNLDPTRLPDQKGLIGVTLNGRYLVQSELKRGGMGVLYLARDQQLHSRPVVVKVLLDDAFQSEYVVQKFRQEVEALSRIDHPGIVGIIDAGELPNGRPFIIMQYVEGVTLRSVMSPQGMNLERVADLIKQIGRALAFAHNRGIFHRDLKPDNIMLQNLGHGEEQVKIIDFGIAKVKNSVIAPSTSLNLSPGTVAYMAPEQLNGRPITAATDIFALGAIAYEMVTGRKPFNPETGFELLQMQQSGVRVKPADLRPSLPPDAQEVIIKALSFNPGDRFEAPRDFSDSLARGLEGSVEDVNVEREVPHVEPLPTQPAPEAAPLEKTGTAPPDKTIKALFQAAPPVKAASSQPAFNQPAEAIHRSRSRLVPFLAIAGILLATLGVAAIWYAVRSGTSADEGTEGSSNSGERNLSYGLTVQKMRNGRPYQDSFESSGQEIFESGWKFRMNISSPQSGHLYLLNEGLAADEKVTYNMLFPAPSTNSGSPQVAANERIQTGWMVFDQHQGTEKFWIVWTAEAVPELEAVKGVVNPRDRGEVRDDDQTTAIKQFLDKHSSTKPEVEKDRSNKETDVRGKGKVLVHFVELEHH
jgi:tRNA A-37 threonylcarbamoyl transferase component Bud32